MALGLLAACPAGSLSESDACLHGACGDEAAGAAARDTEPSEATTSQGDGSETSASGDAGGGGGDDADPPTTGEAPSGRGLPCDVRDVVDRHCTGCHSEMPIFGAPMSLFDYAAWRVPAHSDPTQSVAEIAAIRIVDEAKPMPASGPMPAEDLEVLQAWLDAGTPRDDAACEGDDDDGSDSGTETDADDSDSDSQPDTDPDPEDLPNPGDLPCEPTVELTAHDGADPFHLPAYGADNLYQCFTFHSPVGADSQAIAWAPIIDDERVLHHWMLFRTSTDQPDGGSAPCQMPEDATIVAGWAPGGDVYVFPDDVGLDLGGADGSFILQVHYNNSAHYDDVFDRSGVAMCVTDEPREHTAALLTLGTDDIDIPADVENHEEVGMCPSAMTVAMPEPLHVLSSFPHMHERGASLRTEILRGGEDGPAEILVDVPHFDVNNQQFIILEPELLIEPGDAVRTTCTWSNEGGDAVQYGLDSEDEMCFDFVMVWPIEAFGPNHLCMQ